MKSFLLNSKKTGLTILFIFITASVVNAANYFSIASGSWTTNTTWSLTSGGAPVGAGIFPVAGDGVTIEGGFNVTLDANSACATLTFTLTTATSLTLAGFQLDVSGAITIPRSGAGFNEIIVGTGILNAGSVAFTDGAASNGQQITISTGTVTVTGNVTQVSSTGSATIAFSGAGTLNLGGTFLTAATGTLTLATGCIVNYNAAGVQIVGNFIYNNLTLSGTGAKTLTGATINATLYMQGTATGAGTSPTYGAAAILEYKGSAAQTTTSSEFPGTIGADVIINNAAGVKLNSGKTVNGRLLTITLGTLDMANNFLTVGGLTGSGDLTNLTGTPGARTLTVNGTLSPPAYSGIISDGNATSLSLAKNNSGTLTLSGMNTYTGVTSIGLGISGGVLSVSTIGNGGVPGNLGAATNAAANLVLGSSSSTLKYTGATASTDRNFTSAAGATLIIEITTGATTLTMLGASTVTSANLFKTGAGTLQLSAANGYTGLTAVLEGTLQYGVNDALSSGAVQVDGGTLDISTFNDAVGTVTLFSGTITGTSGVLTGTAYDIRSGTVSAILAGAANLTKISSGTATLSGLNTYTGTTTINSGTLSINTLQDVGGGASSLGAPITGANGTIALDATGVLQYTGAGHSSNRVINTTQNNIHTIDASGSGTLTLTGDVTGVNFPLVLTGSGVGVMSGLIAVGTGTLTKNGVGTWEFGAANTYTGTTTITAGILKYGINDAILTGNVTVNGGTLDISTFTDAVGTVTLTSGTIAGTSGVLTSTTSFAMQSGTVSAILAGILIPLNKTTAGTVTLSGMNTYTGVTTISAGILSVGTIGDGGVAGNLGAATNAAANLFLGNSPASTLQYTGATASTDRNYTLSFTLNIEITSGATTLTMSGASAVTSGGFNKTGTGTLQLSAANGHTGTTTVSAGKLLYGINNALSSGPVTVNGTFDIATFTDAVGAVTLIDGTIAGTTGVLTGNFYTVQNGSVTAILAGIGSLTKNTAGTVTLSGMNTYTGITTISAGTLKLGILSSVATSGPLGTTTAGTGVTAGAALDMNGFSLTALATETLTLNGTGVSATGALTNSSGVASTFVGTVALVTASSIGTNFGGDITVSGVISGANALTKVGTGMLTLSALNSYTGKTTISDGTISINTLQNVSGGNNSLGNPTTVANGTIDISGTATLLYTGIGHTSNRVMNLTGDGGTINASGSGAFTLTGGVTGNTFDLVLTGTGAGIESGVIGTGAATVTKDLAGTWTLSGANTYTAGTTLTTGTLNINNLQALGTVAGTFTINGGAIDNTSGADITTLNYPLALNSDFFYSGSVPRNLNLGTGNVTMNADRNIFIIAGNLTIAGIINNSTLSLTKSGPGVLSFGANAVTLKNLTIIDGTLVSTSGTMSLAGNFSNNSGPIFFTHNSGIVNFNGSAAQIIGGFFSTTFNNLTIDNTNGVSLGNDETVNAALTLTNGNLIIPAGNTLTIANGNAIAGSGFSAAKNIVTQVNTGTGAKGFVRIDNMATSAAYSLPVSDGTNYLPVTLTPTEIAANNTYSVCVFPGITANGEPNGIPFDVTQKSRCVDAVWTVNYNGGGSPSTDMTVEWPALLEGINFQGYSNIGIAHWDGPDWGVPAGTGNNVTNTATRTAITAFSPFAVGNPDYLALAIKITYFNAAKGNGYNTINWQAQCSSPQAIFEILRSYDGSNFTTINAITASQARCAQPFNYQDNTTIPGTVYYRLKVIDVDGKVSYSAIVKLGSQVKDMELTGIVPNPVANNAQLMINTSRKELLNLAVISADGKVVYRNSVQLQPGSSVVNLDIANLPAGMYMIKGMFSDGQSNTLKFLKK